MKKVLLATAAAVLLVVAGLVAVVIYRKQQSHDVRGSSTEEFVTTQQEPVAPPPGGKIRWPMYRFDPARQGDAPRMLVKPPYRPLWFFRARSLVEFPPAVAYGRLYFANADGTLFAVDTSKVKARWTFRAAPLHRGHPGSGRPHRLHVVPEQAALQRDALRARRPGGGAERRHREGALARDDRADRVVAARRGRRRLRGRLEREGVRAHRIDRRDALDLPDRRQGQERDQLRRRPRLLRLLRPPRLRPERAHREALLARLGAAAAWPARTLLLDARGRLRPGLHRLDRRQGLLLRRHEREAALVARHRRLRLRLACGLAASASTPAPTTAPSTASTRPRATCAGPSRRWARSPARRS